MNKAVDKASSTRERRARGVPLSMHPLSLDEALKGAMQTGKPPEPENKRAKRTATKRRLKGESKD